MMFDNLGSSLPLVESDKLKLIAVASPGRLTRLPNVPTVAESLPGFQSETWNSMVAPPGTPSDILEKINADVNEVLRQSEVAGAYAKATAEVTGGSRADMAAHIKQESE